MTIANGQDWNIYGVGGTGTLTGVPDGTYPISNVFGVGGDGPISSPSRPIARGLPSLAAVRCLSRHPPHQSLIHRINQPPQL
jgi:hypothetical protein